MALWRHRFRKGMKQLIPILGIVSQNEWGKSRAPWMTM
jgi:hypothetical protein